jgi:ribosomal protein S6
MKYEICYLIGESNESGLEKIKGEVEAIISQEGGSLLPEEKMEKRKMAYKVKKEVRGIYMARRFEVPVNDEGVAEKENVIEDITKKLNLKNEVLRFMIVKADELPPLVKKEEEKKEEKKPEKTEVKEVKKEKKPEEKPKAKKDEIDDELDKILNI